LIWSIWFVSLSGPETQPEEPDKPYKPEKLSSLSSEGGLISHHEKRILRGNNGKKGSVGFQ